MFVLRDCYWPGDFHQGTVAVLPFSVGFRTAGRG